MIDPIILTTGQLAERWKQTTRQVLEFSLAMNLPAYFHFDGLVFSFNDKRLRFGGDLKDLEKCTVLKREIEGLNMQITRSLLARQGLLNLTPWEEVFTDEGLVELREEANKALQKLKQIEHLLDQRTAEREQHRKSDYVRAVPQTILKIARNGSVEFPRFAYHPSTPTFVYLPEAATQPILDGTILALEEPNDPVQTLMPDNLYFYMSDIRKIEEQEAGSNGQPMSNLDGSQKNISSVSDDLAPAERRARLDMKSERGVRRRILEQWDAIETEYGTAADAHQVLRVLLRDKGETEPTLKTLQNRLIDLRKEGLIP